MRTRIGHVTWQLGNQNIFIKLYFSQPRWTLKNRTKKLKEREEEEEEEAAAADENREPCEQLMRRKSGQRERGPIEKKK